MAAKQKIKIVHCRYPKCSMLHESTELNKNEAVQGGSKNSYYHPDCYHTLKTVNEIRDLFCKEVDPAITGKQISQLVSIVNNMIFSKNVDVDMILFALKYFIRNKPGKLRYPGGIAYIVQDKDVVWAWNKEKERKVKEEIKSKAESVLVNDEFVLDDLPDIPLVATNITNKKSKFSSVLGV